MKIGRVILERVHFSSGVCCASNALVVQICLTGTQAAPIFKSVIKQALYRENIKAFSSQ